MHVCPCGLLHRLLIFVHVDLVVDLLYSCSWCPSCDAAVVRYYCSFTQSTFDLSHICRSSENLPRLPCACCPPQLRPILKKASTAAGAVGKKNKLRSMFRKASTDSWSRGHFLYDPTNETTVRQQKETASNREITTKHQKTTAAGAVGEKTKGLSKGVEGHPEKNETTVRQQKETKIVQRQQSATPAAGTVGENSKLPPGAAPLENWPTIVKLSDEEKRYVSNKYEHWDPPSVDYTEAQRKERDKQRQQFNEQLSSFTWLKHCIFGDDIWLDLGVARLSEAVMYCNKGDKPSFKELVTANLPEGWRVSPDNTPSNFSLVPENMNSECRIRIYATVHSYTMKRTEAIAKKLLKAGGADFNRQVRALLFYGADAVGTTATHIVAVTLFVFICNQSLFNRTKMTSALNDFGTIVNRLGTDQGKLFQLIPNKRNQTYRMVEPRDKRTAVEANDATTGISVTYGKPSYGGAIIFLLSKTWRDAVYTALQLKPS
eukprot:GHVS01036257.1.p1 GENE.GHVS01036257.1~~GHVS01036257.1.p1  ORF type:complete len:488 (-),score=36.46 GHVS01036257.1:262-1725(-)